MAGRAGHGAKMKLLGDKKQLPNNTLCSLSQERISNYKGRLHRLDSQNRLGGFLKSGYSLIPRVRLQSHSQGQAAVSFPGSGYSLIPRVRLQSHSQGQATVSFPGSGYSLIPGTAHVSPGMGRRFSLVPRPRSPSFPSQTAWPGNEARED